MYLLDENALGKLELTELSALYHSLCSAKDSVVDSSNMNPVFTTNQISLLNMMISQMTTYANMHNYVTTDTNLIIRDNPSLQKG